MLENGPHSNTLSLMIFADFSSDMGCDGALYAFSLFIPTIIQQMGYKNTHAQLLSVPPYAVAAVVTITVGFIADRTGKRGALIKVQKRPPF